MTVFNLDTAADVIEAVVPACVKSLGLSVVSIDARGAVLRMPSSPAACREGGIISGQALASLADTAMVCALWSVFGEHRPVATVDLHVTYLRAADEGDVLATAEVVKQGRSLSFARVSIASAAQPDRPLTTAVGTFAAAR
jgi:uncharacterized protein (TIGR00369 family)